uniref:NADH-ubiquinone oxidoreductase chain 3 n=1 Tax=Hyalessa maculaticollis TaxID=1195103 RepID=A0A344ALK8_9HEMI|nr:NADH dehydrogenase subunit 3 [Hyalessa maculaticollis]ULO25735.1 NADH dehydrogenase subunit 3 [Hyalessa maculaticollis]
MMNILIYSILLFMLLFMLTLILYFFSYKSIIDREKMSSFECGFDAFESSRIPFSSHFFMIAVIFLIFDVELVIIMPMIILMKNMNIIYMYMIMYLFLLILIMGLYYEWYNKILNWL